MLTVVIVAQLLIPLALLAWLGLGRPRTRTSWLARTVMAAGWLVVLRVAGLWTAIPQATLWLWIIALAATAALAFRRTRRAVWWPEGRWARAGTVVLGLAAVAMAVFAGRTLTWRTPPAGPAVDLAFPLRAGPYLVVNGGSSNVNNGHVGIPHRAMDRYRGQTRAVDLIGIDLLGRRSDGLAPSDPAAYRIFGDTIFAPCAGPVITASDGLPDQPPPQVDRDNMAGNHVILQCDGAALGLDSGPDARVWVVLAHMARGSVRVAAGQAVDTGEPLGRVGNTGNTDEPHLHIHAQRPGSPDSPMGAEPLVIRFEGRYLARNDRVAGSLHRYPGDSSAPIRSTEGEGETMSAPLSDEDSDRIPDIETIYEETGEPGLREELAGLDRDALEEVVRAHPPHHTPPPSMQTMSRDELVGYIIDGVKRETGES